MNNATNATNDLPRIQLQEMLKKYNEIVDKAEQELIDFALEHGLHLSLGDYGTGRTLIHEDDHWTGKGRGEWVYSSESC